MGESPIDPVTQILWAEPAFDDSKWETVDLTPASGAIDPIGGLSEYVTGWTDRGIPATRDTHGIAFKCVWRGALDSSWR